MAATAPFSSSSWMMRPPSHVNQRRAAAARVHPESATERSEFHPSVLRTGSPTQVRLGVGQVATARLPRSDRSGASGHFETPPRAHRWSPAFPPPAERSPASSLSLSLEDDGGVDRGGQLFIDDIALRDMRLSRGGAGYPWLRFTFDAQPSKCTAPYRIGSSESESYRYVPRNLDPALAEDTALRCPSFVGLR